MSSKIGGISAEMVEEKYIETPKGHLFGAREAEYRTEWADMFCAELEPVFRHLGYGLARLGSNVRDVDIIAVPWCKPMPLPNADSFVLELVRRFDLQMGKRGETLNGHQWYALWHKQHRDQQIDLKVMLPSANSLLASGDVVLRKDVESVVIGAIKMLDECTVLFDRMKHVMPTLVEDEVFVAFVAKWAASFETIAKFTTKPTIGEQA